MSDAGTREKARRGTLNMIGHYVVGLVFFVSGSVKGMHLTGFANMLVERFPWYPPTLGYASAATLALLEVFLAACFFSFFMLTFARRTAIGLLVLFICFLALGLVQGISTECACYGALVTLDPISMILQDAALVFLLGLLDGNGVHGSMNRPQRRRFFFIFPAILALCAFGANTSHFDRFLLKLRPGFEMENLPSLHGAAPNKDAKRLVVITEDLSKLDEIQSRAKQFPGYDLIILLTRAPLDNPSAPVQVMVAKADLMPYFFHRLPTSFMVEDQVVTRVWYGTLPEP